MVQKSKKPHSPAPQPKRRGRPRAYQPDIALGRALDLFRKGGFAATSLDDLEQALDHLVGGGHNARICRIGLLGHDQLAELGGDVDVR